MEAVEVIGLLGNIITFVNLGSRVIKIIKEAYESASGATRNDEELTKLVQAMHKLVDDLSLQVPSVPPNVAIVGFWDLSAQCKELSQELLQLLEKFRLSRPGSKRAVLRVVWNNMLHRGAKDLLVERFERCQKQLNLQLAQVSRYVSNI